jgi:hypothetical protein
MNLKRASIGATAVLPVALVGLLVRHALFAVRPGLVVVQVLAVILAIWARLTFGIRSMPRFCSSYGRASRPGLRFWMLGYASSCPPRWPCASWQRSAS